MQKETDRKNKSLLPAYQVYDEWEKIFLTDYEFLNGLAIRADYEFERIMLAVTRATPEALLKRLLDVFQNFEKELPEVARIMTGCYSNWNHLWGDFDPKSGNYAHFINGILDLKEHTEDYKDFYYNLADYRSKCVLTGILKFRLELDLAYKEPITFLKMDIEGSEINALLGAKEHIVNDKPRLAVCTYHNYSHLWQAMQTIRQLRPDYRFYLRFYGKEGSVTESEHVLYAI